MARACAPAPPELQAALRNGDLESPACASGAPAPALPPRAAVATLTQNILGAGILALPFAFESAGLAGGLLLLALVYALSVLSMAALVLLSNELGEFSYKAFAVSTLGGRWPALVEVWVLCYNLGCCISYPILLGDFMHKILTHFFVGLGSWCTKKFCMTLVTMSVCWPLSCAPSLGGLRFMSLLGIAGICFTVVAVVKRYADGTYHSEGSGGVAMFNLGTFGNCFPILVGAFGAHYNIPALYQEVAPGAGPLDWSATYEGRAALTRMLWVILGALTLSSFVYGAVGLAVYATFGSNTSSDFSEDYHEDDIWLVIVRGTMTLAICASFPLTMVSARMAFFNIALRPRGWVMDLRVRLALTTILTGVCLGFALVAGNIGVVLGYNGSVFGTPVCYIAPAVMYLRLPRQSQKPFWRLACFACAFAGVVFGLLGIVAVASKHGG